MAGKTTPKVSVIMPAYNAEKYIEQSIRSAMNQTYENLEIIVIDDCSQDNTAEVVERLAREDSRIKLVRNEKNMGAARSRNRGMDLCEGEYVALLDCDDLWYPHKLELQLALANKENADIVYCSYAMVDENGNKKCADFNVSPKATLESMLVKCEISCSTALLGRRVMDAYRFPTEYYNEDYALWLILLRDNMKAVGAPEILAEYRLLSGSRASNKIIVAKNRWKIYRMLMGFSVFKSMYYFVQYASAGFVKYKKL